MWVKIENDMVRFWKGSQSVYSLYQTIGKFLNVEESLKEPPSAHS